MWRAQSAEKVPLFEARTLVWVEILSGEMSKAAAQSLKAAGNDFFKNKNYENAKRPIEILASTDNEEFMELAKR